MDDAAAHRRSLASTFGSGEDSLIFFGQGGELAYMAESGEASAEERIRTLLGEAGERGLAAARRRVMRRPLGSGGYQAQSIIFSERDRDSPASGLASEPLSELLHLASTRKGQQPTLRAGRESTVGSVLQSLMGMSGAEAERKRGGAPDPAAPSTPAQQARAAFMEELLLSSLGRHVSTLGSEPLDAAAGPGV
jgi:hypothetical protein